MCIVATHDTTDALSFADEILVIRNGKLVAKNTPETLYNNPKSNYVASFFNEVNEISTNILDAKNTSKDILLLYPNQLKIVENSKLKATVIRSYFKGSYYLIEADLKGKIIFFEHSTLLSTDDEVFIEINN